MAKETKNKANNSKKEKKEKSTFFRDFKAELKKVTWPTPKQLATKTSIVIAIVILISVIVFVLDTVFDKGYEFIVTESTKNNQQENVINIDESEINTEEAPSESTEDTTVDAGTTAE